MSLQSVFTPPQRDLSMDGINANGMGGGASGNLGVGIYILGSSKFTLARALINFDVSALVGIYSSIDAAQLEMIVPSRNVVGSPPGKVYRCTRPDTWVEADATWNKYDATNNWTTAGGDYDGSTPTPVAFTLPGSGDWTVTGLTAFVTDAIASRSNIVSMILRMDDESASGTSRWLSVYSKEGTTPPVLRVTYMPATVSLPVPRRYMEPILGR